nr:hypothetical protein [Mycolicibacterium malmesburyense]CRL75493.1 hypothetical alanine and proline rich protein [Mycolicibacterium malmesburyense]
MTQDVDPETFYLVGKRLHELAGQMYDAFATNVTILGETGAMAGSDDEGTAWAASYDARAREILDAVNDLTLAMENYGGVVIQAGHNHAIAEHNATPGGGGTPPERPPDPQSVAGVLTAPPSAGGPGQGLIDNALGLVDQIGVPVPDGDTDKIDKAAEAWDRLATVYQTKTVPEALDVQAGIFSDTTTPEVEYIAKDLGELRDAANAILSACGELSQSCTEYRSALDDLRDQLTGILEDLAVELAATAVIVVAASLVTFGAGAVAATAKTAHTITKFAKTIRTAIAAWKTSKNISKGVKKAADLPGIRRSLQRIKDLGRKDKKPDERKPPSTTKFPPDEASGKVPPQWRPGRPNNKGVGQRWEDPANPGNGVRIDQGNPNHTLPSQQGDHVIVRVDGKVIGRDGVPINGSIKENAEMAHIPLEEWLRWSSWSHP